MHEICTLSGWNGTFDDEQNGNDSPKICMIGFYISKHIAFDHETYSHTSSSSQSATVRQ